MILESKFPIVGRIVRGLPGGYRFTPARDIAAEIEWAKNRRIGATGYASAAAAARRDPPIPVELMARAYADYERARERAGRIDFEDMLGATLDLLEDDPEALAIVRARKRWFSVDEYQDTNPLQERLLSLWAGPSRDVCVVGDEDQTIYSFTGASSHYLRDFARTHPGTTVIALTENYRSSPEILGLANRLLAGGGRAKVLTATHDSGPSPSIAGFADAEAELDGLVRGIRARIADGVSPLEMAVLVRMNAQLAPVEAALTAAGLPYIVRGGRFYERPDVRSAIRAIERAGSEAVGAELPAAVQAVFGASLGYDPGASLNGPEERERAASLEVLLTITRELVAARAKSRSGLPGPGAAALLAELARRDSAERTSSTEGITLSTIHRAKGLEWDAVFLPGLEEGNLPVGQAAGDPEAIAEERRLLYVGITRARRHLDLSWAERRAGSGGREGSRRRSRFLDDLGGSPARPRARTETRRAGSSPAALGAPLSAGDARRFEALKAWRAERARADAVPAYVIAHDATLRAIAEERPASTAALRRVKGMGPARLERYGDEILAILARA